MSIIKYNNKVLKKIVNVYELNNINEPIHNTLGNYINGSFCLLQICIQNHINFLLDISKHPISKYVKTTKKDFNYNSVDKITIPNNLKNNKIYCYNTLISHLNTIKTEEYYINLSMDAFYPIQDFGREYIKLFINPINPIIKYINIKLEQYNLKPKSFSIIYIKTGNNNVTNITEYDKIIYLKNLLDNTNNDKKYIVLSDNNQLKSIIKKEIYNNNIIVLEKEEQITDDKNNIIDLYLLSQSNSILSFVFPNDTTPLCIAASNLYNIPIKTLNINI
jgi:hypothetical protein